MPIGFQRPIVEFSVENRMALVAKQQRKERAKVNRFLFFFLVIQSLFSVKSVFGHGNFKFVLHK